jgi:iron-sulfur cluster insertion protein
MNTLSIASSQTDISSSVTKLDTRHFNISDSAAARITHLLLDEPAGSYLRIRVDGGGCSGFQYHFDFDATTPVKDDHMFTRHGASVVVDDLSLSFLKGGVIDYVEALGASYFEIKNPNSTASCGCGNSFAV